MKKTFVAGALFMALALGCTDLSESPQIAISPGNFYRNEAEVLAGLAGVYAQLRSTLDDYYNVSEISTDEMIVPTRGQDWYDGGTWLDLHAQTWNPTSPATGAFLGGAPVNAAACPEAGQQRHGGDGQRTGDFARVHIKAPFPMSK